MAQENDKMKDLLIKLQILTNGLVEERKKSKNYLDKIKELEKMLQQKDNEVVDLTKQKFELQANLTFERSKKVKTNSKKKNIDENQINHYEEIINEQGFRLRDLNNKLINEKESFIQQKEQFQLLIKQQTQQIVDLKQKFEKIDKENTELVKRQENINLMLKKFEEEKKEYSEKFESYQTDKVKVQNKNVELQNLLDEVRKENYEKDKEILELKKKNEDISIQLNEMKKLIVNKQLTPKSFKVEMIKLPKKTIEILFQKNKEMENYEIVIKGKSKKGEDEHINILDVSSFLINDKDKNRVDIEYMVSIFL
jgi:chromosome segregation ATPase